ncbi:hypothetical protein [Nitrosopumilus sp.]|uniref:hypothetical protein n=1 Tax=Nitrosopumilus sp. TaxID=2024843 RepID=UPI00247E2715|nr:hypothetical protein [Nitrosopumilus sp.]MCV0409655.1 hypothetical protein [Nitrosopumilus sp.]
MKTKLLTIPLILFLIFSGFTPDVQSLSCAIPNLGDVFDKSDYVIHGKVLDKNYLTWDPQMPIVTFQVLESFKGNAYEEISITVNENWDYKFEDGFEYVVFVYRQELSLLTDPCWPKFHAFPSTLEIARQLVTSNHEIRSSPTSVVYESLTEQELIQLEENQKVIQEKKLERWDAVTSQRLAIIITSILLILIAGIAVFVVFRRKRK